jgi:hypothetical protein
VRKRPSRKKSGMGASGPGCRARRIGRARRTGRRG